MGAINSLTLYREWDGHTVTPETISVAFYVKSMRDYICEEYSKSGGCDFVKYCKVNSIKRLDIHTLVAVISAANRISSAMEERKKIEAISIPIPQVICINGRNYELTGTRDTSKEHSVLCDATDKLRELDEYGKKYYLGYNQVTKNNSAYSHTDNEFSRNTEDRDNKSNYNYNDKRLTNNSDLTSREETSHLEYELRKLEEERRSLAEEVKKYEERKLKLLDDISNLQRESDMISMEIEDKKHERNKVDSDISSALERKGNIEKDNLDIEKKYRSLIGNVFGENREANRKEIEKEFTDEISRIEKVEESVNSKHKEMEELSTQVQAGVYDSLNKSIEEIKKLQTDFYNHIYGWQVSLYNLEFEPIAKCYAEYYRLLKFDKIIDQVADLLKDEDAEKFESVIKAIENLNESTHIRLMKFEKALYGLGLKIIMPEEGAAFDDDLYELSYDCDIDYSRPAVITKILSPGVERELKGAAPSVILRPMVFAKNI